MIFEGIKMEAKKENKKLIIKKDRCLISISNDITLTQRKIYNILLLTYYCQLPAILAADNLFQCKI